MLAETEFRRVEEVIFAQDDGQLALFHPTTGAFYALNGVGELVWVQLQDWSSLSHLTKTIAASFAIPPEIAQKDLMIFLGKLEVRGLLEKR